MNKELRKHYPADLALGEPLPETNGLPELDNLDASDIERVEDSSFENKPFDSPTPLTDSNTPRQCLVDECFKRAAADPSPLRDVTQVIIAAAPRAMQRRSTLMMVL